ncbi:MAG: TolC family protein, partial [Muribaculaceae bacterium]|nr:TolC family protein [Muribaculaceae bacterium]
MKLKYIVFVLGLVATLEAAAMDLTLSECREMALQTDEDMQIAQNRVEQSRLDKAVAKTGYLPKFDINGGAFYLTPNPSMGESM